jgi:hypothetical protein
MKTTPKPFDPWAQCAKCKDVHRESERGMASEYTFEAGEFERIERDEV